MIRDAHSRAGLGAAIALFLGTSSHAAEAPHEWSYTGASGPEQWGYLDEAYATCHNGSMQSPIELADANAVGDLDFSVDYAPAPLVLSNNGKTVQAKLPPGSYMTSGGKVFALLQVHFHTPSEHTLDGKAYPMVAHFVHATENGQLGVLGIMFEEGEANGELPKIIDAAGTAGPSPREFPGVSFDPRRLLPEKLEIWRYMGSLTTPPCTEGVNWHIARSTVTASPSQLQAMTNPMGMNARPLQPRHNRLLVEPD